MKVLQDSRMFLLRSIITLIKVIGVFLNNCLPLFVTKADSSGRNTYSPIMVSSAMLPVFLIALVGVPTITLGYPNVCDCFFSTPGTRDSKQLNVSTFLFGSEYNQQLSICYTRDVEWCSRHCDREVKNRTVMTKDADGKDVIDMKAILPEWNVSLEQLICQENPNLEKVFPTTQPLTVNVHSVWYCLTRQRHPGIYRPALRYLSSNLKGNSGIKCNK